MWFVAWPVFLLFVLFFLFFMVGGWIFDSASQLAWVPEFLIMDYCGAAPHVLLKPLSLFITEIVSSHFCDQSCNNQNGKGLHIRRSPSNDRRNLNQG